MRTPTSTRRSSSWRTVTSAVIGFGLGSIALVRADALHVDGIAPGHVEAIADALNPAQTARVNAAGELSAIDLGVRTKLDTLTSHVGVQSYDGQGALRVATQG